MNDADYERIINNKALDIDAYLERIKYQGPIDVSLKTLQRLHISHTLNVPFENLDIHLGRRISLEPDALFHKIVRQKRGGYCYEMNGLFALVLKQIGFQVEYHMARIMYGYKLIRPRSHQLLVITIDDNRWIADVGFGGHGLIAPLPLKNLITESQFSEKFRLVINELQGFVLQCQIQNQWQNLYSFTLETYLPVDYAPVNYVASTSPDSLFTRKKICTMPNIKGRTVLTNMKLKITSNGKIQESEAKNNDEYLLMLKEHFGIEIQADFTKT